MDRRAKVPRYPVDHVVRFVYRHLNVVPRRRRRLRILDLGCGGGRHASMFANEGFDVVGMDHAFNSAKQTARLLGGRTRRAIRPSVAGDRGSEYGMCPSCRTRRAMRPSWPPSTEASTAVRPSRRGRIVVASFLGVPFDSNTFDAVVSYGVLCYGLPEDTAAGISEIRRVLKPGGWAFFTLRGTDDSRYGRGREIAPHCFVMDSNETNEGGMTLTFVDAAAIDALTSEFSRRFVGYAKVNSLPGRTDSDWLVEVQK